MVLHQLIALAVIVFEYKMNLICIIVTHSRYNIPVTIYSTCYFSGLDINPAIRGLMSLSKFIEMITLAETEHSISNALLFKMKHNEFVCKDLIRNGLREYMFS